MRYITASDELNRSLLTSTERELISMDPFAGLPIQLDHASQSLYRHSIAFLTEDCFATTFHESSVDKGNRRILSLQLRDPGLYDFDASRRLS